MGDRPAVRLFAELIDALHEESDALVAADPARLAAAASRKEHVLRLLAPQTSAMRVMRHSGADERERFAREAAQLAQAAPHATPAGTALDACATDHLKNASTIVPSGNCVETRGRVKRD